jgi:putative cardiolipin synthase
MDEGIRPENSYRLTLESNPVTGDERLVWTTELDGEQVRYYSDPETTFWRRLGASLIGLLPIEEQL